jgi:hypothetical protein
LDDTEIVDLLSPDVIEKFETEDTVENVRSGEGHDEIAGVGEIEGEGEELRRRNLAWSSEWSSMMDKF